MPPELCSPVLSGLMNTSDVSSRRRMRSANQHQLVMPLHRHSRFNRQSFSFAALMVLNSLPDSLRDPTPSINNFRSAFKTHLFATRGTRSALEAFCVIRSTNPLPLLLMLNSAECNQLWCVLSVCRPTELLVSRWVCQLC